jgi:hypothetical protein
VFGYTLASGELDQALPRQIRVIIDLGIGRGDQDAGLVHRRVKAGNVGGHLREHLVDQFSVAAIDARHIAQVQP